MTASTTTKPLTFADERDIRDHYQRMLDSWELGAETYAECFTPDATYIVANGKVQRGWQKTTATRSSSRRGPATADWRATSTASPSSPPTSRN